MEVLNYEKLRSSVSFSLAIPPQIPGLGGHDMDQRGDGMRLSYIDIDDPHGCRAKSISRP